MEENDAVNAGCETNVRSGGAAVRMREKAAALPPGELLRRFEALDDSVPMTDEDAEETLAEAGLSEREMRAGLERLLGRIAATLDEESSR